MHKGIVPVWDDGEVLAARTADPSRTARPVHIDLETLGIATPGELLSLSATGARVLPRAPMLVLNQAVISVGFQFEQTQYLLSGLTSRCNRDGSIPFEFDFVTRERVRELAERLARAGVELAPEQASTAQQPEPSRAEQKARQLAELRRVRHERPPGGIERRIEARYDLGAQAALTILKSGKVMSGELLELSLTGCRVFTEEPNRYPQYTAIEVQFVGLGFPLRLGGHIQINRAQHVAGLCFTGIRPRTRERLQTLLWELARTSAAG